MNEILPRRPEVLEFLTKRRSHAALTIGGPAPDEAELDALLAIATRVPDHGKLAPWRFVIYRSEADRRRIGERLAELAEARLGGLDAARREQELTRFSRAPLVVGVISRAAVHPKIPVWEQELSAGAVCMNLINAALASGYAAQWLSEWYCFDEEASRFLGCGESERFAGFIHLGTATQVPAERARPVLADLCSNWSEV